MLAPGDYEEHAILLCNYILALGMPAWVVIGKAIPEGESAYVLANYDNEFWLWNAIKAECYNINSFFCPMQSVSSRLHEHWIPLHYDRSGLSSERIIYGPTSSLTSRRIRFHLISPSQLVSKYRFDRIDRYSINSVAAIFQQILPPPSLEYDSDRQSALHAG